MHRVDPDGVRRVSVGHGDYHLALAQHGDVGVHDAGPPPPEGPGHRAPGQRRARALLPAWRGGRLGRDEGGGGRGVDADGGDHGGGADEDAAEQAAPGEGQAHLGAAREGELFHVEDAIHLLVVEEYLQQNGELS